MAKVITKTKDNPRLEQSTLSDGRISLFLDYYLGRKSVPVVDDDGNSILYTDGKMSGKPKVKVTHLRRKETLNLYLIAKPKTIEERAYNKDTLMLAQKIRSEREQQLKENKLGYRLKKESFYTAFDYFEEYYCNYTKKDIRIIRVAINRFRDFLKERSKYNIFCDNLRPDGITNEMVDDFVEYLKTKSTGCELPLFRTVRN